MQVHYDWEFNQSHLKCMVFSVLQQIAASWRRCNINTVTNPQTSPKVHNSEINSWDMLYKMILSVKAVAALAFNVLSCCTCFWCSEFSMKVFYLLESIWHFLVFLSPFFFFNQIRCLCSLSPRQSSFYRLISLAVLDVWPWMLLCTLKCRCFQNCQPHSPVDFNAEIAALSSVW